MINVLLAILLGFGYAYFLSPSSLPFVSISNVVDVSIELEFQRWWCEKVGICNAHEHMSPTLYERCNAND